MIRATLILLLSLFVSTSAIAGHRMHCEQCCKKCKKHEQHMCKVMCKGHGKGYGKGYGKRGNWHPAREHRNCCANFSGGYDHYCGYCYEYNRGYDDRRVDQGRAASFGTCQDRNCESYGRGVDVDDDHGDYEMKYKRTSTSYSDRADDGDYHQRRVVKRKYETKYE